MFPELPILRGHSAIFAVVNVMLVKHWVATIDLCVSDFLFDETGTRGNGFQHRLQNHEGGESERERRRERKGGQGQDKEESKKGNGSGSQRHLFFV